MEKIFKNLSDDRVLLIGGAGFIGHHLALKLAEGGVSVMVFDNLMVNSLIKQLYGLEKNNLISNLYLSFLMERLEKMREAGVLFSNGDARITRDMNEVIQIYKPTKVVHLAAIASAVEAKKNPGLSFELQLNTLQPLLEFCRINPGLIDQVILLSSSTVYGDFETLSVDESTRPRPRGIYANTKYMAERLIRTYCHQYGLNTVIIRPSALYGERCVSRRVSQVFIENALNGKPLYLEGGGEGRLDFTYISDLIDGIIMSMAFRTNQPGGTATYNITCGNARTIMELATIVKNLIPSAILEERPRAKDKPIRGTLSVSRAEREIGFKSQWPLERGYKKYCEWYIENWNRAKALHS